MTHVGYDMTADAAIADLIAGSRAWPFWAMLGWNDVKQRYRRTLIGPFWITASMALMIGALAVIYSSIFQVSLSGYVMYLAAGIVTWFFLSTTLMEGISAFTSAEGIIKQSPIPFTIYIYRVIWRNVIVLLHNAIVVAGVFVFFGQFSVWLPIQLLIGIAIVSANLFIICLALAIISTRYRDLPPMVANLIQVLFYVTPILFEPSQLPNRLRLMTDFNPFYHLVDVLRRPMVGQWADLVSYEVSIGCLIVSTMVTLFLFRRYRSRIAYWL
jgi:ABC-type polysaccharide/polyol phosphate export permease